MNILVLASLAAAFASPMEDGGVGDAPPPRDELPSAEPGLPEPAGPDGIWNGTPVAPGGHPAVVAVAGQTPEGPFLFCSGTLVTPDWVLTAAHCLQGVTDVVVLFGDDLANDGYTDLVEAADIHPHPGFDADDLANDVGLVRLADPKDDVDPVLLSDEPITVADHGDEVLLVGFGFDPPDGGSGIKREGVVSIVAHDARFLLTDDPDTNLCQGDSGGPGFEQRGGALVQVGVSSFVTPECIDGSGGLTRVDAFLPWIRTFAPDVRVGHVVRPPGDPDDPRGPLVPEGADPLDPDRPEPRGDDGGGGCDTSGAAGGAWALIALLAPIRRRRSDKG